MNCYSIPPSEPFLRRLAEWVLAEYGHDTLTFTQALILLPGRRACKSLRDIFLDVTGGKPLLLPRIQPIGDVEDNDFLLVQVDAGTQPPIDALRRQLLLMQLVNNFERHRQGRAYNMEKSAQLATDLGDLLDEVQREGLDFSGLENIVPSDLQRHWQQTLDFLKIVSQHWPKALETESASDPVQYRNKLLGKLAASLEAKPPAFPIIIAGSTGSQPATARLIAAVAKLPEGRVVLPALDKNLTENEWKAVDETHPQFMLKQLLERIGCKRSQVKDLCPDRANARSKCISEIFKPSEYTSSWKASACDIGQGLRNMHLIHADTLLDEARSIAIVLRGILGQAGKTGVLITPDRQLARMVSAEMQRFGISIDDSAGKNLSDSPTGIFLQLVINAIKSDMSPIALLALLRHPLASAGIETAQCRQYAAVLEKQLLRGIRREAGLGALIEAAQVKGFEPLAQWLAAIHEKSEAISTLFKNKKSVSFGQLLQLHIQFAEWMVTTPDVEGHSILWAREAGQLASSWLTQLLEHADVLPDVDTAIYPATFGALMSMQSYWPQATQHPRIHILSPIEARLQQYDCVILGGLTEKSWPAATEADPWMSRPMRKAFGLPALETAIGQAAHDVFSHCHADEVWLSRSHKVEGVPTVDSRWLVRLETLASTKAADVHRQMYIHNINAAKAYLNAPDVMASITAPSPRPPFTARPQRMRVTDIDKWLADPYYIYAKYILRLRQLDDLDKDPDNADFGNLIHHALDLFVQRCPQALPADALVVLHECGREAFSAYANYPAVQSLWWPRFESVCTWFLQQEEIARTAGTIVLSEVQGEWLCKVQDHPLTLVARMDRAELQPDGSLRIIDYKTGSVPSNTDIKNGLGNQLYMSALIVRHGTVMASMPIPKPKSFALEYWKLAAKHADADTISVPVDEDILVAREEMLRKLILQYQDEKQPYAATPASQGGIAYNEYDHLTRRLEWESV